MHNGHQSVYKEDMMNLLGQILLIIVGLFWLALGSMIIFADDKKKEEEE